MAKRTRVLALILTGVLVALSGCGGGGGEDPPAVEPITSNIVSMAGLDGYLLKQPSITMVMNDSTKVMTGDFYNSGSG